MIPKSGFQTQEGTQPAVTVIYLLLLDYAADPTVNGHLVQTETMQPWSKEMADGPAAADDLQVLERHLCIRPGRLVQLQQECKMFSEICADYEECCAQLRNLERDSQAACKRAGDYAEMRDLLVKELAHCLAGTPPCRCCGTVREKKATTVEAFKKQDPIKPA